MVSFSPVYQQTYKGRVYQAKRMYFLYQSNPGYLDGCAGYHHDRNTLTNAVA